MNGVRGFCENFRLSAFAVFRESHARADPRRAAMRLNECRCLLQAGLDANPVELAAVVDRRVGRIGGGEIHDVRRLVGDEQGPAAVARIAVDRHGALLRHHLDRRV